MRIDYTVVEECRKFVLTGGVCATYSSTGRHHSIFSQGRCQPTNLLISDKDNIIYEAHRVAGLRCVLNPQVEFYVCTLRTEQLGDISLISKPDGNKATYVEVYFRDSCIYQGSRRISFSSLKKLQEAAVSLCVEYQSDMRFAV